MSFFDDASLVQIPSGISDGTLYSVKPIDGSGDLTFSRGSDIEATRINSQGYIEKAQVNLLLQSNTFNTTWFNSNSTETSGQAGYDGTNNAWLLQATNTTQARLTQTQTTNGLQTFSVYAKAGTSNFLILEKPNLGTYLAWFDLSNGTLGTVIGGTATITSVGSGWYRCTINGTPTASADVRIFVADGNGSSAVTIGGNIYIQDAQLNYGLVAQTYQETTTAAVVSGITNDMPRLNYDPANPTCPSLILEPSRTNLLPQSEYYDGSEWTKTNATITTNATTSPEGVVNASKYEGTNATNALTEVVTAANGTYTFSIFVKKDATDVFRMNLSDGITGEIRYLFNLSTEAETLTKSGGTISDYSSGFEAYQNGWYRLHITATTNSGSAITTYVEADNQTGSYFLYGAQLEAGSYVSSMIPTYGSSATRTADAYYNNNLASLHNTASGFCLMFDYGQSAENGDIAFQDFFSIQVSSGTQDGFRAEAAGSSNSEWRLYATNITTTLGFPMTLSNIKTRGKVLLKVETTGIKIFADGVLAVSQSGSVTIPTFGTLQPVRSTSQPVGTQIKQSWGMVYFSSVLSDADCITLTA